MNNAVLRRRIAAVGVPAGLEVMASTFVFTINTGIVARLGDDAVAGVGMSGSVTLMLVLLLAASGSGGMVVAAQHHGAGNVEALARTVGVVLALDAVLNVLVCAALFPFAASSLRALGLNGNAIHFGTRYLEIALVATPVMAVGRGASEMIRSVGMTRLPFYVNTAAVVVNVPLTALLVFGAGPVPALGVDGAAFAMLISQSGAAVVLVCLLLAKITPVRLRLVHLLRPSFAELPLVLRLGFPQMLSRGLWGVGAIAYDWMFNHFGTDVFAAWRVMSSIDTPMILIAVGLETAALAVVGSALGGRDIALARRSGRQVIRMTVVLALVMGALYAVLAPFLDDLYPALSENALYYALAAAGFLGLSMPIRMSNLVILNGVLRAGGDTRFLMVNNMITVFAISLPVAFVLGFALDLGFWGVLAGRLAEEVSRIVLAIWRYRGTAWQRTLVPATA
jgi:putative MATE family efflux protein